MTMRHSPFHTSCASISSKTLKRKEDHGPEERWRHSGRLLELTDKAGVWAARALETDILDKLVLANVIADRHKNAALRLRADFQAAGLSPHLASSYNPVRSSFSVYGGWDERSDEEEEAYARWRKAVHAVGSMFSDCVVSVVCYDETPSVQKLTLLTVGLVKLMRYYEGKSDQNVDKASAGE